jgi:hypothetical protein
MTAKTKQDWTFLAGCVAMLLGPAAAAIVTQDWYVLLFYIPILLIFGMI